MRAIRAYTIPVVMTLVACHHFYRVQAENLVSWRGGGFGMYASFHPRQHEVWIERSDSAPPERYAKYVGDTGGVFYAVRPTLTWPSDARIRVAWDALEELGHPAEGVAVYRLAFDPKTCVLTRVRLARAPSEESAGGGGP